MRPSTGVDHALPTNRRNPYLRDRGLEDVRPGSAIKTYDCDNLGNPNTFNEPDSPPPCQVQSGAFTMPLVQAAHG